MSGASSSRRSCPVNATNTASKITSVVPTKCNVRLSGLECSER
jgi:hypothetical protein